MAVLTKAFVREWANRYEAHPAFEVERRIFRVLAPQARARGHFTRDELMTVARWKSPRPAPRYLENDEAEVQAVTKRAFAAKKSRRPELLDGRLVGVSIRTATALLTVFAPKDYTILDVRAVESLHALTTEHGSPALEPLPIAHWDRHYLVYNATCRALAMSVGVDLRSLDRAMWQWSKAGLPHWPEISPEAEDR